MQKRSALQRCARASSSCVPRLAVDGRLRGRDDNYWPATLGTLLRLAGVELLLALLELDLPLVGADGAAPGDVGLEIGAPLGAGEAALTLDVLLLLLDGELATAEPKRLRYRLLHVAARITRSARRTRLRIAAGWPWAAALVAAFTRLAALPRPAT